MALAPAVFASATAVACVAAAGPLTYPARASPASSRRLADFIVILFYPIRPGRRCFSAATSQSSRSAAKISADRVALTRAWPVWPSIR